MAEGLDLLDRVRGCTFDDFLLTPQLGIVPSRDPSLIDLSTRFTTQIALKRPFVSANMDTITRAAMAVALAEEGGIGVIDRGFRSGDIAPQIAEVTAVKRTQHGIIADPHTIGVNETVADAMRLMERTGVGTLVVTTEHARLAGLLTRRDVRFVEPQVRVGDRMTPLDRLVSHTGPISFADAARIMAERKVKKIPLVNADGTVLGLITARDLINRRTHPFATRDESGRLRVAAAVGATGDYLERAVELQRAGADAVVIDIAPATADDGQGHRGLRKQVGDSRFGRQRRHGQRATFLLERASMPSRSASGRAAVHDPAGDRPGDTASRRSSGAAGRRQPGAVDCRRRRENDGAFARAPVRGNCVMLGSA
jgi:IMP dehydrogenase/GMP reductase